jgi:membrane-associated phospholipid phosphatase
MILDAKNYRLEHFSDLISSLPLCAYFSFLYLAIIKNNPVKLFFIKCLSGLLFTTLTADFIKRLPYPRFLWDITRRPIGAKNTDYLSKNGECRKDAPGFPSGHMSSTAFTLSIMSLYFVKTPAGHMTNIVLVFLMAWSRWFKGVHNLFQILAGLGHGCLCAYLTSLFL